MTLLTTAFSQGTHAARPAAASSNNGFYYYETDTTNLFQSTGSAWQQIASTGGASPLTTKGDLFGHSTVDARIPVGADGTVLTADSAQTLGLKWAAASGGSGEIGYDQITSTVNVTGTAEGSPTTIITCAAHTFDGAAAIATFYGIVVPPSSGGGFVVVDLRESGTVLFRFAYIQNAAGGTQMAVTVGLPIRFTPSAGSHSYVVGAWCSATTGTPNINAGAGGPGVMAPAYVRFTKA